MEQTQFTKVFVRKDSFCIERDQWAREKVYLIIIRGLVDCFALHTVNVDRNDLAKRNKLIILTPKYEDFMISRRNSLALNSGRKRFRIKLDKCPVCLTCSNLGRIEYLE